MTYNAKAASKQRALKIYDRMVVMDKINISAFAERITTASAKLEGRNVPSDFARSNKVEAYLEQRRLA